MKNEWKYLSKKTDHQNNPVLGLYESEALYQPAKNTRATINETISSYLFDFRHLIRLSVNIWELPSLAAWISQKQHISQKL